MAPAPTDEDLLGLLAKMTFPEKISMLSGQNFWETAAIERLGIPALKVTDGPNGARGADFVDGKKAACFPASVLLAATFNRDLAHGVGVALGQEAQTKGAYVLLGPTVCPHRSPVGGRNFESFSEDPVLAGELASQYILGVQSENVGATVKHFAANEQETRRFVVDEAISDRALREIYLRPFEIVVKKADPWCIMTSYNKVNGKYIDNYPPLMKDILRREWGFQGLVMSDWGSTSDAVAAGIRNTLDLEMPGPPHRRTLEAVSKAVDAGEVDVSEVDARVLTILQLLRKTGKFTYRRQPVPEQSVMKPEHGQLIREAGGEGIVLLKNDRRVLPLDRSATRKIAAVGPLAKYAAAHGGGSASLNSHYKVSPHDALTSRLSDVEVTYSKGAHLFRTYPFLDSGIIARDGKPGFLGEYYKTLDMSGEPFAFHEYSSANILNITNAHLAGARAGRVSTIFTPAISGNHHLSFSGLGPTKLFINGELISEVGSNKDSAAFFAGSDEGKKLRYAFQANVAYDIVLESTLSPIQNSDASLFLEEIGAFLGFITEQEMDIDLVAEAVVLAKQADVAICFVGHTDKWETEGIDRADMSLPANGSQDRLVAAVCDANPNTIVVLTTGGAVELPWIDQAAAVMQAFYAGQETGNAIVDVLFGEVNPSGKLPFSWPRKYEHTACYGNFGLDSFDTRKVDYVEGVNVGYRHFDALYGTEREVMFPFGHGLSYTTFEVSATSVLGSLSGDDADFSVKLAVSVRNTGRRAGSQVIQVYVAPPPGGDYTGRPPKALATFGKVHLAPGEQRDLELGFKRDAAAFWAEGSGAWKVVAGDHKVLVCTSSAPHDVHAELSLNVVSAFTFGP